MALFYFVFFSLCFSVISFLSGRVFLLFFSAEAVLTDAKTKIRVHSEDLSKVESVFLFTFPCFLHFVCFYIVWYAVSTVPFVFVRLFLW